MIKLSDNKPTWDNHPATFSKSILVKATEIVRDLDPQPDDEWYDPFGGTGKIHAWGDAIPVRTFATEIEEAGANMHPRTMHRDSTKLPRGWTDRFEGVFTSPGYANRMSDHHDAKERCKPCEGSGLVKGPSTVRAGVPVYEMVVCEKCGGSGKRTYKRNTYTHTIREALGDPSYKLDPNNSGAMQWGDPYRNLHRLVWAEATRATRRWFLLNSSNHIRKGEEVDVTGFHVEALEALGWSEVLREQVDTPRNRQGENAHLRCEFESLILFERPYMG